MLKKINFAITATSITPVALIMPPNYVVFSIMLVSLVTAFAYSRDKKISIRNARSSKQQRRTPESSLLLLSLFGGGVGALFGQVWFNHKISKTRFIVIHMFNCVVHGFAIAWMYQPSEFASLPTTEEILNMVSQL